MFGYTSTLGKINLNFEGKFFIVLFDDFIELIYFPPQLEDILWICFRKFAGFLLMSLLNYLFINLNVLVDKLLLLLLEILFHQLEVVEDCWCIVKLFIEFSKWFYQLYRVVLLIEDTWKPTHFLVDQKELPQTVNHLSFIDVYLLPNERSFLLQV